MQAGLNSESESVESVAVSEELATDSPFEAYYRGWQSRGQQRPCTPPPLLPSLLQEWYSVGWSERDMAERRD